MADGFVRPNPLERSYSSSSFVSGVYVSGIVDSFARGFELAGNTTRSKCVMDWYYGGGPQQIAQVFNAPTLKGKEVFDVVNGLIRRACPNKPN